ncbi:hypothetical protein [Dyella sp.]|uniref:hypothetical protein n=1 Tax=Dyella sp. TaxID=1869338 RepID=UPI002B483F37|nr:hypothetical protein [Dyella sp.]HKT27817.1 hypothetical protein [Dyella sp.]
MRFFHIVSVSESALRKHKRRDALAHKLGQHIIDACLGVEGRDIRDVHQEIEARGLIQYFDEFGNQDLAFYACVRGRLVSPFDLNEFELRNGVLTYQLRLDALGERS